MLGKFMGAMAACAVASTAASAPVIRCSGQGGPAGDIIEAIISVPDQLETALWIAGQPFGKQPANIARSQAGWGRLLTSLSTSDGKHKTKTSEHKLIVTQLPADNSSLAAMYFVNHVAHPFVIKADLWHKDRAFWLAGDGHQYVGKCE